MKERLTSGKDEEAEQKSSGLVTTEEIVKGIWNATSQALVLAEREEGKKIPKRQRDETRKQIANEAIQDITKKVYLAVGRSPKK